MRAFGEIVQLGRPDIPDGYFRVVRAGALEMGIGSAALPKLLIRLAGPSDDPADDVLLEAKAVRPHGSDTCLEQPASTSTPTFRIVQGSQQVGRLTPPGRRPGPRDCRDGRRGQAPERLVDPKLGPDLPRDRARRPAISLGPRRPRL